MNSSKNALIDSVNGNQLGNTQEAKRFFELRGYDNRNPQQANVGGCLIWSALKNAVEKCKDADLRVKVSQLDA